MKRSNLSVLITAALMLSLFMTGCSFLKPIYGDSFHASRAKPRNFSHDGKAALKIKVLAAPLVNMAGFDDEKLITLTESWIKFLKEDVSLLVTPLTGFESAQSVSTSTETGIVTDNALIKKAEEMGMNILITLVLEPLNYSAKRGIIWPFDKFKGEYDVSMVASAVDIISGTLIFSFRDSEKIKMGEVPEGQKTPVPLDRESLDNVLYELQKRLSSELLDLLSDHAWRGTISLEEGRIKISGGTDIGITAGSIFNVFGKGHAVKSVSGKTYHIDGPKEGEIKITDVMGSHSFAVPIGGKFFEAGQVISLKPE